MSTEPIYMNVCVRMCMMSRVGFIKGMTNIIERREVKILSRILVKGRAHRCNEM